MRKEILLFLLPLFLFAGTTGKITGRVVDAQTGEPLPFVQVILEGTGLGAVTDVEGYYVILNVPPGTYVVVAKMIGYHEQKYKDVEVFVDQTTVVNFRLTQEVIKLKEEVIVYGKKIVEKDVTETKHVIRGKDIERMPVRNVQEALLTHTSFTRDARFGEIHVRGGRGGEVLYMIDGMEVVDPLVGGGLGMEISNVAVQEMDILTGGFNAEYGEAQSAVINIVTKEGSEKKMEGNLRYLSDAWGKEGGLTPYSFNEDMCDFSMGGPLPRILPGKAITYFASVALHATDTYVRYESYPYNLYRWGPFTIRKRQENIFTYNTKLTWKITPSMKLGLLFNGSRRFGVPYDHEFRLIPWNAYHRWNVSNQIGVTWVHTLSAKTFYTLKLGYFDRKYTVKPGGKDPDEINHYTGGEEGTSDNPLDVVIGWPGIDGQDEPFIDFPEYDGEWEWGEDFVDFDGDGEYDPGEPFADEPSGNYHYDVGEPFNDYDRDGIWDGTEPYYDYGIDGIPNTGDEGENNSQYDEGEPFVDYNGNGIRDALEPDGFFDYGFDQWAYWHTHRVQYGVFKFDITSQVTKIHLVKTGLDFKYYAVNHKEIQYGWWRDPYRDTMWIDVEIDPATGETVSVDTSYLPGPWKTRGIFRDFYTRHPWQGAWYIQDKIETEGMVVNVGLRLDFFNPGNEVANLRESQPVLGIPFWKSKTEYRLSPRLGVSYPVTEYDKFYFNYGHFSETPEFQYFYEDTTQFGGALRLYGNPNLHAEKTIAYEFGVHHAFNDVLSLKIAGFFKDIRGLIDTEKRGVPPITYQMRVNKDYGSVRGIEAVFSKAYSNYYSFLLSYTLSWAMGNSSSDRQGYDYDYRGIPLPLREYPLDWDERHRITFSFDVNVPPGEHPVAFGWKLWDYWGFNVLMEYGSGLPFTPTDSLAGEIIKEGKEVTPNCMRMPYRMTWDVSLNKGFKLGRMGINFVVQIKNIFNKKNWLRVYSDTGTPWKKNDPDRIKSDPTYIGPGRQILFGMTINW